LKLSLYLHDHNLNWFTKDHDIYSQKTSSYHHLWFVSINPILTIFPTDLEIQRNSLLSCQLLTKIPRVPNPISPILLDWAWKVRPLFLIQMISLGSKNYFWFFGQAMTCVWVVLRPGTQSSPLDFNPKDLHFEKKVDFNRLDFKMKTKDFYSNDWKSPSMRCLIQF